MSLWDVQLFELNYDEREAAAVQEVLDSGWITMGQRTLDFEAAFERLLGGGRCVAVSNGTAALHLALMALDVGPGDEVIVPALTFVADLNVVEIVGARPVLADCESLDHWNLDVADVERKMTDRTRAVLCVHYAGYACRMDELAALCRRRGVRLIEDAAHAPGGSHGDRALGTIGDVGCWSFFTNKNLSVGEGGMVWAGDDEIHQRLRLLRSHGMTSLTLDRHQGRAISYDVLRPGLNYRIDEMRAALGLVQLDKLAAANESRRRLMARYEERLAAIDGIHVPFRGYDPGANAYHICPVMVAEGIDRDAVVLALRKRRIQASIHYPEFASFTAYAGLDPAATPVAAAITRRQLTLPLYPTMSNDQVDLVCAALSASLTEVREPAQGA